MVLFWLMWFCLALAGLAGLLGAGGRGDLWLRSARLPALPRRPVRLSRAQGPWPPGGGESPPGPRVVPRAGPPARLARC
jgi:hypothetical protein